MARKGALPDSYNKEKLYKKVMVLVGVENSLI
jgi:hypothetical protein